jgi:hypothetical protein
MVWYVPPNLPLNLEQLTRDATEKALVPTLLPTLVLLLPSHQNRHPRASQAPSNAPPSHTSGAFPAVDPVVPHTSPSHRPPMPGGCLPAVMPQPTYALPWHPRRGRVAQRRPNCQLPRSSGVVCQREISRGKDPVQSPADSMVPRPTLTLFYRASVMVSY